MGWSGPEQPQASPHLCPLFSHPASLSPRSTTWGPLEPCDQCPISHVISFRNASGKFASCQLAPSGARLAPEPSFWDSNSKGWILTDSVTGAKSMGPSPSLVQTSLDNRPSDGALEGLSLLCWLPAHPGSPFHSYPAWHSLIHHHLTSLINVEMS